MTRLGIYIIHNISRKLIKTIDVPWDFGLNASDGSVEPNPLPPPELIEPEDFTINDIAAQRMILYIRQQQNPRPEKPIILRNAAFIVPYTLAEKVGIITKDVDEDDITRLASFVRDYPDLKTNLYLTNENIENEYLVRIMGEHGERLFLFEEDNLPNFSADLEEPEPENPDTGEEGNNDEEGIMPLSDEGETLPPEEENPEPNVIDTNLLDVILQSYGFEDKIILIPSDLAVSEGILQKDLDENEDFIETEYEDTKFIFFKDLATIPAAEEGKIRLIIDTIPQLPQYTDEELFILWFRGYFYSTLVKDENFIGNLNTNRTYVIISQENENIMGLMTLYKGRAEINFTNHNYAELIDRKFPNIRDDMIIMDEEFGGYDSDDNFTLEENKKPKHPCHPNCGQHKDHFGGYDDDSGFLI